MDRIGVKVCTAAALGCAAVATHGCGDAATSAAPSAGERLDLGVVGVSARIGDHDVLGSGVVIDGDQGLVLTAAHGVWGARSLRLATALGILHGRIVARAPCDDLALLELHPRIPGLAALPSAPAGAGGGQLLRSIGRRYDAPASALASIPVRTTLVPLTANSELPLPTAGVALDSPLVPEVSGGPVVDEAGRLVGMADSMGGGGRTGRDRAVGADPGAAGPAALGPAPDLRRLGAAVPLRRAPARLRARHAPRLPRARRAALRPDRADAAARHGRDRRLMSAVTESQRPAARLPRWAIFLAGALMLILLLAPAVAVLLTREPDVLADGHRLPAGRLPTDVAVQGSTVWVVSGRDNRVVALDAADVERAPETRAAGASPLRLAVGEGSVWTANAGDGTVTRFDPLVPGSGRRIPIGAAAVDVAVSSEGTWVTNGLAGTVTRIDPVANRVLGAPVRTGSFPAALTVGAGYVWVVNAGDGTVARIDPREDLVIGRRIAVGRDPQDIAVGHGSVWVANRGDGTVTRLSARTGRREGRPIAVGGAPGALAVTRDGVLVLDTRRGDVWMIAPSTGRLSHVSRVSGFPTSLAVGAGSAWIVDARGGTVTRLRNR